MKKYLPVERMVGKHLQFRIRDVPILIRGTLFKDFLVLHHVVDFVFSKGVIRYRSLHARGNGID